MLLAGHSARGGSRARPQPIDGSARLQRPFHPIGSMGHVAWMLARVRRRSTWGGTGSASAHGLACANRDHNRGAAGGHKPAQRRVRPMAITAHRRSGGGGLDHAPMGAADQQAWALGSQGLDGLRGCRRQRSAWVALHGHCSWSRWLAASSASSFSAVHTSSRNSRSTSLASVIRAALRLHRVGIASSRDFARMTRSTHASATSSAGISSPALGLHLARGAARDPQRALARIGFAIGAGRAMMRRKASAESNRCARFSPGRCGRSPSRRLIVRRSTPVSSASW